MGLSGYSENINMPPLFSKIWKSPRPFIILSTKTLKSDKYLIHKPSPEFGMGNVPVP